MVEGTRVVQHKHPRRPAGAGVRGWPKVTLHLPPAVGAEAKALAESKGLSLSEALATAIEAVGLPYLRVMPTRERR